MTVHVAKTTLSKLIERARAGEEEVGDPRSAPLVEGEEGDRPTRIGSLRERSLCVGDRYESRLGKLDWPVEAGSVRSYVVGQGFRPLPISVEHAERAGQLPIEHRDPFDRMLIAQAQSEDLLLVSNEALFDDCAVRRHW